MVVGDRAVRLEGESRVRKLSGNFQTFQALSPVAGPMRPAQGGLVVGLSGPCNGAESPVVFISMYILTTKQLASCPPDSPNLLPYSTT